MRTRGRWRPRSLSRRLFVWFGLAILLTGATVVSVMMVSSPSGPGEWKRSIGRLHSYVAARFVEVWDDPAERDRLARETAEQLNVGFTLEPVDGPSARYGDVECPRPELAVVIPIERNRTRLGVARVCHPHHGRWWRLALTLGAVGLVLWGLSMLVARRIVRPLRDLVSVANAIGAGQLDARVDLTCQSGEFRHVSERINAMATRIEQQIADQRELLAAVSHEIRTPLGHMRILIEMAQDLGRTSPAALVELEAELVAVEGLVSELLASSRLDFQALTVTAVDPVDLASRALDRLALDPGLLEVDPGQGDIPVGPELRLRGDPTLLDRALTNLLDNAVRHAGGPTRLTVSPRGDQLVFAVVDDGPGFPAGAAERLFQPFVRGQRGGVDPQRADGRSSLGLGLSLVSRIAAAHDGRAWVEEPAASGTATQPKGGAVVCFSVALSGPAGGAGSAAPVAIHPPRQGN